MAIRLADIFKFALARWSDGTGVELIQPNGSVARFPKIIKPSGVPCILASLVAGATYGQSGTTVTVTATAHGLPTTRNGYRIFWPGSAAVAAGWYAGFAYVDANRYTFTNPTSQTVAEGTAITGTLPYVAEAVSVSQFLPAGTFTTGGYISARIIKSGDGLAAAKYHKLFVGGQQVSAAIAGTAPLGVGFMTAFVLDAMTIIGGAFSGLDGANTNANQYRRTVDTGVDQTAQVRMQLSGAGQWASTDGLIWEIG